jgi:hypothetical protein
MNLIFLQSVGDQSKGKRLGDMKAPEADSSEEEDDEEGNKKKKKSTNQKSGAEVVEDGRSGTPGFGTRTPGKDDMSKKSPSDVMGIIFICAIFHCC